MKPRKNQVRRNLIGTETKDLLLRDPNFVSNSGDSSFERRPLACEASALTAELTALNYFHFNPKGRLCKYRPPVLAGSDLCSLSFQGFSPRAFPQCR